MKHSFIIISCYVVNRKFNRVSVKFVNYLFGKVLNFVYLCIIEVNYLTFETKLWKN